ncbi:hypothetical protein EI94DRAFT_1744942 [Lactarius quietus]|nr:hypothetical protein EI94DRAFT_1744942 [Lactarius quietus]
MLLLVFSSFRLMGRGAPGNESTGPKSEGAEEAGESAGKTRSPRQGRSARCLLQYPGTSTDTMRFSRHSCSSYSRARVLLWELVLQLRNSKDVALC